METLIFLKLQLYITKPPFAASNAIVEVFFKPNTFTALLSAYG